MFFLLVENCVQWDGFTASRLIFEVDIFLLHLLKYLGLFFNRLIFEGRLTFEEIRVVNCTFGVLSNAVHAKHFRICYSREFSDQLYITIPD